MMDWFSNQIRSLFKGSPEFNFCWLLPSGIPEYLDEDFVNQFYFLKISETENTDLLK